MTFSFPWLSGCRGGQPSGRLDLLPPIFSPIRQHDLVPDRRILGQQRPVLGDPKQRPDRAEGAAEHAGGFNSSAYQSFIA